MKGVLKSFLLPKDFYADDVADMVGNCIQRHGEEEWRAVVLTNEILLPVENRNMMHFYGR